jgi:hypothetical protein
MSYEQEQDDYNGAYKPAARVGRNATGVNGSKPFGPGLEADGLGVFDEAEVAQFLRAWDETLDDLDAARKTIARVKALAAQWEQVGQAYQSLPEGAAQLRQVLDEVPL